MDADRGHFYSFNSSGNLGYKKWFMKLPFTTEDFLNVFKEYNTDFWPARFIFYALAAMALFYTSKKYTDSANVITGILTFLWIWMGIVYHFIYFSVINKAAFIFGSLFILQGLLFAYYGFIKKRLSFSIRKNRHSIAGAGTILFALFIYPLAGYWSGHQYPAAPTFGLPCPTTIFTFGLLLCTDKKLPVAVYIIPVIWAVIGVTAVFALGIKEDISLLLAALLFILINFRRTTTVVTA